ncbi:36452_t:CDS:2, partial [Racocetra persica]
MQSTSRVESINAIIHKAVASSSSMSDIVEALELHMQREELNKSFMEWKHKSISNHQSFIIEWLFSNINNVIRKYFTSRIAEEINKQMCESVLYKCEKLDIDHALEDQLYSDENELINSDNNTQKLISRHYYNIQEVQVQNRLQKKIDYSRLIDHFKKALSYSLENDDQNALDELILDYIAKKEEIRNVQTQLVSVEESQAYDDIKDPVVRRGKGRRPNKWLKAFNEETNKISSNKKQQDTADSDGETRRRCRLCHKSGHYTPKCPNKENA